MHVIESHLSVWIYQTYVTGTGPLDCVFLKSFANSLGLKSEFTQSVLPEIRFFTYLKAKMLKTFNTILISSTEKKDVTSGAPD